MDWADEKAKELANPLLVRGEDLSYLQIPKLASQVLQAMIAQALRDAYQKGLREAPPSGQVGILNGQSDVTLR